MQNSQIIVITPSLPPSIGGVEDYSFLLALQMQQNYQVQPQFIISNSKWTPNYKDTTQTVYMTARNTKSLLITLENTKVHTVLLHYVGYGYAKRGSPNWLINGLVAWKKNNNSRKLVTMFHEIYASGGSIWRSQFWTGAWQKHLATRLIKISDVCLSSLNNYGQKIVQLSNGKHSQVKCLPVFSNVGEPSHILKLSARKKQMVIFGGLGARIRAYKHSLSFLIKICEKFDLEKIIDIGSPLPFSIPHEVGLNIEFMGVLAPDQISEILTNSPIGFLNYSPDFFAKSTIFAAYSSHGLLAITDGGQSNSTDGLVAGQHFWSSDQNLQDLTIEKGEAIAEQGYQWYQAHNLEKQGNIFSQFLINS